MRTAVMLFVLVAWPWLVVLFPDAPRDGMTLLVMSAPVAAGVAYWLAGLRG